MYWDQFAKSLKQLLAKAASPQSVAPAEYSQRGESIAANPLGDVRYDEEEMTPYSPDDRRERCDSSLHLSC
jgi:hypothetical protein